MKIFTLYAKIVLPYRRVIMNYDFFAYLNRMKHIKRWALMRSNVEENVMEHTEQCVILAQASECFRDR